MTMTHFPNLMEEINQQTTAALAHRLGRAAHGAGLPRDPVLVPGFVQAMGGLAETDPLLVRAVAAYQSGYDEKARGTA